MQSHPYPNLRTVGPIVRGKPSLSRQRSSDRVRCRGEDDEEAVSFGPALRAMPARDLFTHDGALNGERFAVVPPSWVSSRVEPSMSLNIKVSVPERRGCSISSV